MRPSNRAGFTLGAAHGGMQQISDGLAAGERVIVDGVQKARPGQKVVAREMDREGVAAEPSTPGDA